MLGMMKEDKRRQFKLEAEHNFTIIQEVYVDFLLLYRFQIWSGSRIKDGCNLKMHVYSYTGFPIKDAFFLKLKIFLIYL